ncbi:hypothetical protein L195_g024603, partial [Trifolium pratense]
MDRSDTSGFVSGGCSVVHNIWIMDLNEKAVLFPNDAELRI